MAWTVVFFMMMSLLSAGLVAIGLSLFNTPYTAWECIKVGMGITLIVLVVEHFIESRRVKNARRFESDQY